MEESFRFDEEIYENAITIDLSNVANKASALYSICLLYTSPSPRDS